MRNEGLFHLQLSHSRECTLKPNSIQAPDWPQSQQGKRLCELGKAQLSIRASWKTAVILSPFPLPGQGVLDNRHSTLDDGSTFDIKTSYPVLVEMRLIADVQQGHLRKAFTRFSSQKWCSDKLEDQIAPSDCKMSFVPSCSKSSACWKW